MDRAMIAENETYHTNQYLLYLRLYSEIVRSYPS